jgi:hypothetical protein
MSDLNDVEESGEPAASARSSDGNFGTFVSESTQSFVRRKLLRQAKRRRLSTRWSMWRLRIRLRRTWRTAFRISNWRQRSPTILAPRSTESTAPGPLRSQDLRFEVLTRLHARAYSLASEVYVLMTAGHASAAYARWRTLHEVAVVAHLITMNDRELAKPVTPSSAARTCGWRVLWNPCACFAQANHARAPSQALTFLHRRNYGGMRYATTAFRPIRAC